MPESPLNFHRAEYGGDAIALGQCPWCGRGLEKLFYLANDLRICHVCAERALVHIPADTNKVFWRSVAWGTAAAIGLSLAMFLLARIPMRSAGWGIGFVLAVMALGTGYFIGKAMGFAAKGAGGRRYQIAAAILTYCAISIGVSASFLHIEGVPLYVLPFLALGPLFWLFVGRGQDAFFVLTLAFLGVRWAWMLLKPWPIKITGPEFLPGSNRH